MTIHTAVLAVHGENGAQPVSYLGQIAGPVLRERGEFGYHSSFFLEFEEEVVVSPPVFLGNVGMALILDLSQKKGHKGGFLQGLRGLLQPSYDMLGFIFRTAMEKSSRE